MNRTVAVENVEWNDGIVTEMIAENWRFINIPGQTEFMEVSVGVV